MALSFNGKTDLFLDDGLEFRITGLVQLNTREEIVDEGEEERFIFIYQLGEVHVTQHSHHTDLFSVFRICTLHCTQGTQHGENVSKTEIVVDLLLKT